MIYDPTSCRQNGRKAQPIPLAGDPFGEFFATIVNASNSFLAGVVATLADGRIPGENPDAAVMTASDLETIRKAFHAMAKSELGLAAGLTVTAIDDVIRQNQYRLITELFDLAGQQFASMTESATA